MANVKDFLRLKETIIRMNLDKDAAEEKAERTTVLLKKAIQKQEEAEKELTDYVARLKLRKEKLNETEELLKDAAWELKIKRQEIRRNRTSIKDLKSVDTKSGDEMQVAETTLKQARGKAGEGRNRLQDAQKKHQTMIRELEACEERTRRAKAQADLLEAHLVSGQARHDELSQMYEERSEIEGELLKTVSFLKEEIKKADNRTEAANRDKLVKENEVCRLRKEIEKIAEDKAKLQSTWRQMGELVS